MHFGLSVFGLKATALHADAHNHSMTACTHMSQIRFRGTQRSRPEPDAHARTYLCLCTARFHINLNSAGGKQVEEPAMQS